MYLLSPKFELVEEANEAYSFMGFLEDHNITGFEYPPQTKIDIFRPYVDQILRLYGPEAEDAWLSDEAIIFDIAGDIFSGECDVTPIEKLGIEVTEHDLVWEVAARVKKLQEG